METVGDLDVCELLPQVKAPMLVMHVRDESMVPSTLGRELAAEYRAPGSWRYRARTTFRLEQDPGLPRLFEELKDFLRNVS